MQLIRLTIIERYIYKRPISPDDILEAYSAIINSAKLISPWIMGLEQLLSSYVI